MRQFQRTAIALLAASAMSGCVAAAIPVLIGGVGVRRLTHGSHGQPEQDAVSNTTVTPSLAAQTPARAHFASSSLPDDTADLVGKRATDPAPFPDPVIESLPTDLRQASVGQVYRGDAPPPGITATMPSPTRTAAAAVPTARVVAAATRPRAVTGWASLGRYVTGHLSGASSALLARGGAVSVSPSPCAASLPLAVLAPATLVEAATRNAADRAWLDALHTLQVTLVLTGPGAGTASATKLLPAATASGTVFVTSAPADMPATRARLAGRYCVLAVAGRDAVDFPNGYLPATTPPAYRGRWGAGWFFFPPR